MTVLWNFHLTMHLADKKLIKSSSKIKKKKLNKKKLKPFFLSWDFRDLMSFQLHFSKDDTELTCLSFHIHDPTSLNNYIRKAKSLIHSQCFTKNTVTIETSGF